MNIPDFCYALNNRTINPKTKVGEVIIIRALEKGYYPTNILATQEEVDEMNKFPDIGSPVSPIEAKAMESASMFGWECYKNVLESYTKLEEKKNEHLS
jgi:hypothetical protein